jgi:DNA-binding transcriptional regulator GbsR (MarR family)
VAKPGDAIVEAPYTANEATLRFVEEMAVIYEKSGHPRMIGRIVAWLLIADPPYQTAGEIGDALRASKGSVSTSLRFLVEWGLVERFTIPPQRRDHYRIAPDMWPGLIRRSLPVFSVIHEVAHHGLELLADADPRRRRPLEEMDEFFGFYEQETADMLERWQARRRGESS